MPDHPQKITAGEAQITIADVQRCGERQATVQPDEGYGYRPTAQELFFFVLIWLVKQGMPCRDRMDVVKDRKGVPYYAKTIDERCDIVAGNMVGQLERSGPAPAEDDDPPGQLDILGAGRAILELKIGNEIEWQLLRIQMVNSLRRRGVAEDDRDDAIQNALIKILAMLRKMPDAAFIDHCEDILGLLHEVPARSLYDFGVPFYAYANRSAYNAYLDALRRAGHIEEYELAAWEISLETAQDYRESLLGESGSPEDQLEEWTRKAHRSLLELLNVIEQQLPRQQKTAMKLTLAARAQFWLLVDLTGVEPPDDMDRATVGMDDAQLAHLMGTNENNLRVHRAHAKHRIIELKPELQTMLEELLYAR